jgi:hypothetical protein
MLRAHSRFAPRSDAGKGLSPLSSFQAILCSASYRYLALEYSFVRDRCTLIRHCALACLAPDEREGIPGRSTKTAAGKHGGKREEMKSETDHPEQRPRHRFPVVESFLADTALLALFAVQFFKSVFEPPYEFREFLKQS